MFDAMEYDVHLWPVFADKLHTYSDIFIIPQPAVTYFGRKYIARLHIVLHNLALSDTSFAERVGILGNRCMFLSDTLRCASA